LINNVLLASLWIFFYRNGIAFLTNHADAYLFVMKFI
jgi:hypothetical protein